MKLNEFLRPIEIESDEDTIHNFLNNYENDIRAFVISRWEDFMHTNHLRPSTDDSSNNTPVLSNQDIENNKNNTVKSDFLQEDPQKELISNSSSTLSVSKVEIVASEPLVDKKEIALNEALDKQIKSKYITLQNGKENQEYRYKFDLQSLGIKEIGDFWFEGLENIGLCFDGELDEIKGIPTLPGQHKLILKCKRTDWTEGKPIFEREVSLIINPDPKNLWKNIPSDKNVIYWKPDSDKTFVKVESKRNSLLGKKIARKDIVAASQRGRSHAHEGSCRDDDYKVGYYPDIDWYILCVADGAGSAKYSRKGSEIFCQIVNESLLNSLQKLNMDIEKAVKSFLKSGDSESKKTFGDIIYSVISNAVFSAFKKLEDEVNAEQGRNIKDYSTTLILAIGKKIESKWLIGSYWVGDGGIGIYSKDANAVKILGKADEGEHAGQTRFVTMREVLKSENEWKNRLKIAIEDDFTALVLMTDGITDPKFQTEANLNKIEKWHELWQDLSNEVDFSDDKDASADQLLGWLDFWSPGNHDDRTIAILY